MADMTTVADTLVARIAALLYPSGTGQPSVTTDPIKVYQGWPDPDALKADLAAGRVHISVWPTATTRSTSRFIPEWRETSRAAVTATAAVSTNTVTIGGTITPGQAVALLVDGRAYSYLPVTGNTPAVVAEALRALIAADQTATRLGAVITVPGAHSIIARLVTTATAAKQVRREERVFQVTVWAKSFTIRDRVAPAIDAGLSDLRRLALTDGTVAQVSHASSRQDDDLQKQGIYRRDLMFRCEYPTILTETDYTIAVPTISASAGLTLAAQGPIRTTVY